VLILDANPDVTSKGPLFKKVWAEQYKGIIEYRGQHKAVAVDAKAGIIKFDVQDDVKANVLNVLPAMRAGTIAVQAGLNNQANNRWCGVNYLTFRIHRREGRACAGRLHPGGAGHAQERPHGQQPRQGGGRRHRGAALGWDVNPAPMLTNTCYSFVDNKNVIHVASVHEYVAAEKTFKAVAGSGGVSAGPTELEGVYALNWASNIWADTLA
jgi:sulfide dehydrogenase [flavocytochrome c] flavoprotein subunit